jgi:two-component sensor histidine kinase
MFRQWINWRTLLAFVAILIVGGTIWYSSYLAHKIEREERIKAQQVIDALISLLSTDNTETSLSFRIIDDNKDIPIIETDEKDSVIIFRNLDSVKAATDRTYLPGKLKKLKSENKPIIWTDPNNARLINHYYYGHSAVLDEVRYYPIAQLFIVGLFILVTLMALNSNYRSTQNQVWAGMAKETAHQLGTPVSSLEGWVEILKETHSGETFLSEMEKDVTRLRLVSDRFGKIGSTPQLEERDIVEQVQLMMEYIRKRAGGKVSFSLDTHGTQQIPVRISAPLFDWVIENLLKNALDAMEGRGAIRVDIQEQERQVWLDVSDTGKGISAQNISRVFKPGFTTKKRGWGLGLSLSKRIIEQYHQGSLTVKQSEIGKGTTFRIVLIK